MTLSATYASSSSATLDCGLESLSGMVQRLLGPGGARARRARSVGSLVDSAGGGPHRGNVRERIEPSPTGAPLGSLLQGSPGSVTEDDSDDLWPLSGIKDLGYPGLPADRFKELLAFHDERRHQDVTVHWDGERLRGATSGPAPLSIEATPGARRQLVDGEFELPCRTRVISVPRTGCQMRRVGDAAELRSTQRRIRFRRWFREVRGK